MSPLSPSEQTLSRGVLDALMRAGLVAILAISCYQVFHPFLDLMLWSLILAVTLYPLQVRFRGAFGTSEARTATLIVAIAFGILVVPIYLLGTSMAASVPAALAMVRDGALHIPPPSDSVATWPVVGKPLHGFWLQAATDLTSLSQKFAGQFKEIGFVVLGKLAGFGIGLLLFIAALLISGIFMAFAESGHRSAVQVASRIFDPGKGARIVSLCTATIRAVAQGVVGIAFIQMLLIGIAFVLMDVPGAGLLALGVLVFGILQLPATLITVPVIAFVLGTEGVGMATITFAIYVFVAGLVDNVLKPLLLGRGVDVPMPVVLIGALGGMVTSGIIGLFIGPVILAVGYQLFWQWVRDQSEAPESRKREQA